MERMIIVNGDAGSAIKEVMEAEKMTQTSLAERAQMNRQAVQQSLNRKSHNMRVLTMQKFVNAMGYELAIVKRAE